MEFRPIAIKYYFLRNTNGEANNKNTNPPENFYYRTLTDDCTAFDPYPRKTPRFLRPTAATVLMTFLMLILEPVAVAAQNNHPPASAKPTDDGDRRFSDTLENIEQQLQRVHEKQSRRQDSSRERSELKRLHQTLEQLNTDERQSFEKIERHLKEHHLPVEILERHREMVEHYDTEQKALTQELDAIDAASSDAERNDHVQTALKRLKAKSNKPRHQPFDPKNLPFQVPEGKIRAPKETPEELQKLIQAQVPVHVAALELNAGMLAQATTQTISVPQAADLAPTEDVQITDDIKALVQSLNNNPVEIYNWVRNNIEYIPTYGSIQGSQLTLANQKGNAFDTASLLIALYRAAGIPARYVYGTVQIPIDQVMNWVGGVTDPMAALQLLGQGGIPNTGMAQGGVIKFVKMEHVWVEAYVDFIPSRGAKHKNGDTWVALDASFKQYENIPSLIPANFTGDLTSVVESYNQSAMHAPDGAWSTGFDTTLLSAPLEIMQTNMAAILAANPDKITLNEVIGGRRISLFGPPVLAASLPYTLVASTGHWSELPSNLRVSAQIELQTPGLYGEEGTILLSKTLSLPAIGYASLNLTHVPATPDDAAIWDSYKTAGAEMLPAYLINVKSRLNLDGAIVAESGALGMGQNLLLKVSFGGAGYMKTAKFQIVVGDEIEIGINGAGQFALAGVKLQDRNDFGTAAGNLYAAAKVFWTQQDFQEHLLARLHGVVTARLPSVGIFAAPLSVVYSFGIPRSANYHSRQVDVKLSNVAAVALNNSLKTKATFVMHSGMTLSSTEGVAIEEVFSKPLGHGSNTMRLLQLANEQKIPIYHLTSINIAANRTALQHPYDVMTDIDNALNAGLGVIIPKTQQTNGAWTGSGYIMIDPKTGAADYRISGGLSGNIDDEACQRVVEPVVVKVPDIELIWSVLFGWMVDDDLNFNGDGISTALWQIGAVTALVGLSAATAGIGTVAAEGAGTAVLTKATFDRILFALSLTAGEAAATQQNCSCTPYPMGSRKGGNSVFTRQHNLCADLFTNYPNEDVELRDIAFDGLRKEESPPGTFYEIKMGTFYSVMKGLSTNRPSIKKFLEYLKAKEIFKYYREKVPAFLCGFEFRYGLKDQEMMKDMQSFFIQAQAPGDAARIFNVSPPCL